MLILILIRPPPHWRTAKTSAIDVFRCQRFLLLRWEFSGTVSSFTRALARYMRWAYLVAANPAAWCRPAVNQILLMRRAVRRYTDALRAEKSITSLRRLSLKFPYSYSATALRVVKLIIWHSGRRLAVNQNRGEMNKINIASKAHVCAYVVFLLYCTSKIIN